LDVLLPSAALGPTLTTAFLGHSIFFAASLLAIGILQISSSEPLGVDKQSPRRFLKELKTSKKEQ